MRARLSRAHEPRFGMARRLDVGGPSPDIGNPFEGGLWAASPVRCTPPFSEDNCRWGGTNPSAFPGAFAVTQSLDLSLGPFASFAEGLPIGVFRSTCEGKILYANPALCRLLGYPSREALLEADARALYADPQDRARFIASMERDGVAQGLQTRLRRADGTLVWVRESGRLVHGPDGAPLYYEGILEDISAERAALETLEEAQSRFLQFANAVDDVIYRYDVQQNRYEFINPAFTRLTGYPVRMLEADPARMTRKIIHPGDAKRVYRSIYDRFRKGPGGPLLLEYRLVTKDGEVRWVSDRIELEFDPDGRPHYMNGIARDVTPQKRAEEALAASEAMYRLLAENTTDFVFQATPDGTLTYASASMARRLGLATRPPGGWSLRDLVAPSSHVTFDRVMAEAQEGIEGEGIELELVDGAGRFVPVEASIIPLIREGKVEAIQGSARDITERRKAQRERDALIAQLKERIRERDALMAVTTALGATWGPLETLLEAAVAPIPSGMRLPHLAAARVTLDRVTVTTPGFTETPWRIGASITIGPNTRGSVEVAYREPPPGPQPFLTEEQILLEQTAERIASWVERLEAVEALRESEERFRDLVEKARIGILIDDPEGRFVYFNDTFAAMFGYSRGELATMRNLDLVHPEDRDLVARQHEARVSGRVPSAHYEFRGLRKDGTTVYLEVAAVELREGDRVVGTRSYVWDVTERTLALQERERLIRELQDALAKVKTLSGLLPICANCKRVRNDEGYWQRVETFIRERSDIEFTHGICPECLRKLYPAYAEDVETTGQTTRGPGPLSASTTPSA